MKMEKKICSDCGEEVVALVDKTGMLIRYKKTCSCIKRILQLRGQRASDFASKKKFIL